MTSPVGHAFLEHELEAATNAEWSSINHRLDSFVCPIQPFVHVELSEDELHSYVT